MPELTGGRQALLVFGEGTHAAGTGKASLLLQRPHPLPSRLNAEELGRHRTFAATLGEAPLWNE